MTIHMSLQCAVRGHSNSERVKSDGMTDPDVLLKKALDKQIDNDEEQWLKEALRASLGDDDDD